MNIVLLGLHYGLEHSRILLNSITSNYWGWWHDHGGGETIVLWNSVSMVLPDQLNVDHHSIFHMKEGMRRHGDRAKP